MALLAETVVEEWLKRQGYFTIRGLKHGNYEIDLLAIRHLGNGKWDNIHVEVQVSINPVGYISGLTKQRQDQFKISGARNAKKRTTEQLKLAVSDWTHKKYFAENKRAIRQRLSNTDKWSFMFVHGNVKTDDEIKMIADIGVTVKSIKDILGELADNNFDFTTNSASDLMDLVTLARKNKNVP